MAVGRIFTCMVTLSALMVSPAAAQRIPDPLVRLRPLTTLRVESGAGLTTVGRLLAPVGDTLFLEAAETRAAVPTASIEEVWERGTAGKKGALIGGAIGGAVLFIFGGVLGGAIAETDEFKVDAALAGAVLGVVGGGLLGGLIGWAIPEWHSRYRAD